MATEMSPVIGPDELPIPFGIEAETGARLRGVTETDLAQIDPDAKDVRERGERGAGDHLAISDIDPNKLEEAGWCVVFTKDADPAIKQALEPLLKHREGEAKRLYKVFEGVSGFLPGDDARKWIERQGAGFDVVDPEHGVPVTIGIDNSLWSRPVARSPSFLTEKIAARFLCGRISAVS